MPRDEFAFAWADYLPEHRPLIALRYAQARRLTKCSLCGKTPIVERKTLVHEALRSVNAHTLDAKSLIRSLALCREHAALSNDELADSIWPGWREHAQKGTG